MISGQRLFPTPSQDTLRFFVENTNFLERIVISQNDISETLKRGQNDLANNPNIVGHLKAVNYVLTLAPDPKLIPPVSFILNENQSHNQLQWLRQIHKHMMLSVAEHGEKTLDSTCISRICVGTYRSRDKRLGKNIMPSPLRIRRLLHDWLKDLSGFVSLYEKKITYPALLTDNDLRILGEKAKSSHIDLCCIKPFEDGSNRAARLAENLLRLNWGLPWKIHMRENKDEYLKEILERQKDFPY